MLTDLVMAIAEQGVPIRTMRELSPTLERETFSGGWNESARLRNRKAVAGSVFCIAGEEIICSPEAFELFFRHLGTKR